MEASARSHTLLLFCKFLAHRVRTENLDLLYNIAIDFLEEPPCFTRVDEMIYRVFPLVAIVPIEITDTATRAKADKVLRRMRDRGVDADDDNKLRDLAVALRDRIALKNWDVLEQMFADFKVGRDHTLRGFVALQPEAIVIVPMTPARLLPLDSSGGEHHSNMCGTSRAALGFELKPDPGRLETPKRLEPVSSRTSFAPFTKSAPLALFDLARIIRTELDGIEATAPWHRVYDVSKIVYPFNAKKHPLLAERFKRFWSRYAHAVWQRHFWCRVPADKQNEKYKALLDADKNAVKSFGDLVLHPLYQAFGAAFFLELDSRPSRLHWWWYRVPVVDLVMMANVEGIKYCKRYMRTQCTVPHPTQHPQFHRKTCHRDSPSPSMWSTTKRTTEILDAVAVLKEQQTRGSRKAMTSRKRARVALSDSDEDEDE